MKVLFNTDIKVLFEEKNETSVKDSLLDLYGVAKEVGYLLNKKKNWYFTGYSRKDAMQTLAFDEVGPTTHAYDIANKHYKKSKPLINEGIWDGGNDGKSCSISHYMMLIDDPKKASLAIELDEKVEKIASMLHFVNYLVQSRYKTYISVSSKGYRLHSKNVFPDRLYVGWMLYIPHIISSELIPEAARVVPVMGGEKQKGTIIISTEEIFDGDNPAHIAKANDIEIKLLDLGFLPLMTEL